MLHSAGYAVLRIDCKAAVDVLCSGEEKAVLPSRRTARVWAGIFVATGGLPPPDTSWMPAHTGPADVGRRRLGNGDLLSERDRLGNDIADHLAKRAVSQHREPYSVRKAVIDRRTWLGGWLT